MHTYTHIYTIVILKKIYNLEKQLKIIIQIDGFNSNFNSVEELEIGRPIKGDK